MKANSTAARFIGEIWLFALATVLGSSVYFVGDYVLANKRESFLVAVCVTLILSTVLLYRHFASKYSRLGVTEIFEAYEAAPSTLDVIQSANISVDFLGISGRTFFESGEIEEVVRRKIKSGVRFRFLVVDPQSQFIKKKALDEGDDPSAWVHDINASIIRLNGMRAQSSAEAVEVRTYDALPIWRLLFIDGKVAYVTYYPHGKRGKQSLVLEIENGIGKIYSPLSDYFNYIWNHMAKAQIAP